MKSTITDSFPILASNACIWRLRRQRRKSMKTNTRHRCILRCCLNPGCSQLTDLKFGDRTPTEAIVQTLLIPPTMPNRIDTRPFDRVVPPYASTTFAAQSRRRYVVRVHPAFQGTHRFQGTGKSLKASCLYDCTSALPTGFKSGGQWSVVVTGYREGSFISSNASGLLDSLRDNHGSRQGVVGVRI